MTSDSLFKKSCILNVITANNFYFLVPTILLNHIYRVHYIKKGGGGIKLRILAEFKEKNHRPENPSIYNNNVTLSFLPSAMNGKFSLLISLYFSIINMTAILTNGYAIFILFLII